MDQPLERCRQRRSHPKVRSTTQRQDMTTNPLASPGLPMISTVIGQFASLIVLPASSPHLSLPASTVVTLRLSMMAALGSALRPDRSRSSVVKRAQTCSGPPDRDHA